MFLILKTPYFGHQFINMGAHILMINRGGHICTCVATNKKNKRKSMKKKGQRQKKSRRSPKKKMLISKYYQTHLSP